MPIRFSVVLAAAHCISSRGSSGVRFEVPSGVWVSPKTDVDGTAFSVTGYTLHPGWRCDSATFCPGGQVGEDTDLALLKLSGFSNNQVICLNTDTSRPANGASLDIMGFRLISQNPDDVFPTTFQGATMTVSNPACGSNSYFCASAPPPAPATCGGKNHCLAEICAAAAAANISVAKERLRC